MILTKYIACICEGAAEQAIIEILLENDRLIFTEDDLLDGEVIRCRSAGNFEQQHLRKGFTEKITVLRILDSRREKFTLSKAYASKIEVTRKRLMCMVSVLDAGHGEYARYILINTLFRIVLLNMYIFRCQIRVNIHLFLYLLTKCTMMIYIFII